jgi:hypothetical protein
MKTQSKPGYGTATLVLVALLVLCFLVVANQAALTCAGRERTLEFGSLLAQARSSVIDNEENIHGFPREGERSQSVASHLLITEWLFLQKITVPGNDVALQDERSSSATVKGLVTDARSHQGIAGARVILTRGRVPGDLNARSKELSVSTLTNERGRFQLDRIDSGVYSLIATMHGYLSSLFHVVEVEPGKTRSREIMLEPLAECSGRVRDESNHPVKGARVGVLFDFRRPSDALQRFLSEQGTSVLMTTTESQGEFDLFVPAEQESMTLVALALRYAPSWLELRSVRAGRARTGILLRLSRGLEAQGRVLNEDGTPILGATILANSLRLRKAGLRLEDMEPRATSGAEGRFVLRGLEKGSYKLTVSHASHATRTVPDVEIQPQTAKGLPDIVLLPDAEIKGRVVGTEGQPIPGAKISGVSGAVKSSEGISDNDGAFVLNGFAREASVVLSATAAGYSETSKVVRAPDGDVVLALQRHGVLRGRVEDAETLTPIREFQILGADRRSFRSENGTFELKGLPPGRWTFSAQAPGYQAAKVSDLEIRAGESTEGVVFSLSKGVALTGRVVDDTSGAALPNVTVRYRAATDVEGPEWGFRSDWNSQKTDADGNFKFDGLPLGKATIIANSPFHAETWRTVVAGEESSVEIRLPVGGSVSGRVVGFDAATPIPAARVSLWSVVSRTGIGIPVDETGAFSFSSLAAGRYRLTANTSVGQSKPVEIVLRESERLTDLTLVVNAGATIRGQVTGLKPDELPVVQIVAQGQGGFKGTASTNPDGTYAIRGLPEGRVEVFAQTSLQRSVSKSVEIPQEAAELVLNIDFPGAGRLSGRVTQGGQPVAYRSVDAFPRNPESAAGSGETDQNGKYTIDGLSKGDYVVSLNGEGAKSLRISGDTILDIELPEFSLSGRVLEANSGKALSDVTVRAQRVSLVVDASISRTALTDALGRFSVEGMEPGQYQFIAYKRGYKVDTEMLSLPASSELVLFLTSAEGITIRVRDGISGLALHTVTVDALSDAQPVHLNVALDETGSGELPQPPPGRYNLFVSSPGYAARTVIGWRVPSSQLELTLTPGGRLEIHVDSAQTGVRASLVDANGIPVRPTQTEFVLLQPTVFPNLAPSKYTLLVKLPERTVAFEANISEGQTTVLQVK